MFIRLNSKVVREFAEGNEDPAVARAIRMARAGVASIEIAAEDLSSATRSWFIERLKARESHALTVLRSLQESEEAGPALITKLEEVPGEVVAFCKRGIRPGWIALIEQFGSIFAYLLYSATYHPEIKPTKREIGQRAVVAIDGLTVNGDPIRIHVYEEDIPKEGIKLSKLLRSKDYIPFTKELTATYEKQKEKYLQLLDGYGQQVVVRGQLHLYGGRSRKSKNPFYWMNDFVTIGDPRKAKCILNTLVEVEHEDHTEEDDDEDDDEDAKAVNHGVQSKRALRAFTKIYTKEAYENTGYRRDGATRYSANEVEIPWQLTLTVFHLELRSDFKIHANNIARYRYRENLADKLILEEPIKKLVNVLTRDSDFAVEDVMENKGGGVILCLMGPPGTGKTLTAEVVAENVKKPLYKISCAELGSEPNEIEENIGKALKRAADWKAVLLLDEADVFVQKRGSDLHKNSVIASMLRQIEYYSGILFLTTNRVDDIDEAILSRCTAVITYKSPTADEAQQLWRLYGDMHGLLVDGLGEGAVPWSSNKRAEFVAKMADRYPRISGRTIHHVLGLVARMKNAEQKTSITSADVAFAMRFAPLTKEEDSNG